jgi:5-methylthioribose kinase
MLKGFYKKEDVKLCIQGMYMEYMIYLENLGLTTFSTLMESAYWTNNFNIIYRRNDFTPTINGARMGLIITQFFTICFSKYFQDIKNIRKICLQCIYVISNVFSKEFKNLFSTRSAIKAYISKSLINYSHWINVDVAF